MFLVFVSATQASKLDEIALRIMQPFRPNRSPGTARRFQSRRRSASCRCLCRRAEKPLPWERAIGLADMALYLAKVHGRNRGYGVIELVDDDNGTLAAVEHDLETAWRSGLVDVHILTGAEFPARACRRNAQLDRHSH
jgi:hypothetical protein